jgi:glycosyltransferase involved in cell wall biosynthesis
MADQVVTIHDIIPIERPDWFSRSFAALHAWLVPLLVQRVRHVITVSEYTRQRLIERFRINPDRVTTIPNGVGEEYYRRSATEIAHMRANLAIPQGDYVLSVCSLEPRKNLHRLLDAWRLIQPLYPATLVVAGARGSSGVFKDADLDRTPRGVHFTGYVPETLLPALYSGASCFAYPSLYEGFGLPVLEALACEVPVVTSNTTSLPEVAGSSATLVDPERIDQIADAIIDILRHSELRRTLIQHGRQHSARFTWAACARSTESLLLSLR